MLYSTVNKHQQHQQRLTSAADALRVELAKSNLMPLLGPGLQSYRTGKHSKPPEAILLMLTVSPSTAPLAEAFGTIMTDALMAADGGPIDPVTDIPIGVSCAVHLARMARDTPHTSVLFTQSAALRRMLSEGLLGALAALVRPFTPQGTGAIEGGFSGDLMFWITRCANMLMTMVVVESFITFSPEFLAAAAAEHLDKSQRQAASGGGGLGIGGGGISGGSVGDGDDVSGHGCGSLYDAVRALAAMPACLPPTQAVEASMRKAVKVSNGSDCGICDM